MTETTLLVNIEGSYTESQGHTQYFTKKIHSIIVKYCCSTDMENNVKTNFLHVWTAMKSNKVFCPQ